MHTDPLEILRKKTTGDVLQPILEAANLDLKNYQQDRQRVLYELQKRGLLVIPDYSIRMPLEARIGLTVQMIESLEDGKVLLIPTNAGVLPEQGWTSAKKKEILILPTPAKIDPDQQRWDHEMLPPHQLELRERHISLEDKIVGYRISGTQSGINYNRIFWRVDKIRGALMEELFPDMIEVKSRYYGIGDTGRQDVQNDPRCFRIANVPSLTKGQRPYSFLLHNVPVGNDYDTLVAGYNLHTKHSCKKDEYLETKGDRTTLSIDPATGQRHSGHSASHEKLVCHHIIAAFFAVRRALEAGGKTVMDFIGIPSEQEKQFYRKARARVLMEYNVDEEYVDFPLGVLATETLLWARIGLANDEKETKIYNALPRQ